MGDPGLGTKVGISRCSICQYQNLAESPEFIVVHHRRPRSAMTTRRDPYPHSTRRAGYRLRRDPALPLGLAIPDLPTSHQAGRICGLLQRSIIRWQAQRPKYPIRWTPTQDLRDRFCRAYSRERDRISYPSRIGNDVICVQALFIFCTIRVDTKNKRRRHTTECRQGPSRESTMLPTNAAGHE